jgi:hypothetical protein
MENLEKEISTFCIEFLQARDLYKTIYDSIIYCIENCEDCSHLIYASEKLMKKMDALYEKAEEIDTKALILNMNIV